MSARRLRYWHDRAFEFYSRRQRAITEFVQEKRRAAP